MEESLLQGMYSCLVRRFPLRVTSRLSKGFQIPETGKFWLVESGIQQVFVVESGILGFGTQNIHPESHKRLESGIQVPLTKNPESSSWNPESIAWNPESESVLDSLTCCNT